MAQERGVALEDLGTEEADKIRREVGARVDVHLEVLIQVGQLDERLSTVLLGTLVRSLACSRTVRVPEQWVSESCVTRPQMSAAVQKQRQSVRKRAASAFARRKKEGRKEKDQPKRRQGA